MIRKSKLSIMMLIVVLLVTLVFCSSQTVFAKEAKYVIRVAYMDPADPMRQPSAAFWAVFKNELEAYTGGEVEVRIFPNGQLGDALENYRAIKAGEIEMSNGGPGSLGSAMYPPISIIELPYMFPDNQVAINILKLDNPFAKELYEGLKKETGVRVIAAFTQGFRNITNNVRPIKSPDDLKGLKMRTPQADVYMKTMAASGAQVVPIAYNELYTSLQTGVVDGQENPLGNIVAMSFQEVQKYLTLNKHILNGVVQICNNDWFESLPDDIQHKIFKAAEVASYSASGLALIFDAVNLDVIRDAGVEVYAPSPEELAEFKRVMQPGALDWYKNKVEDGAEWILKLEKEIKKAE